jgi:hypothetical protein
VTCIRITNGVVCVAKVKQVTDRNGKVWTYEVPMMGPPTVLNRDGSEAKRQPGERSPFWEALRDERTATDA